MKINAERFLARFEALSAMTVQPPFTRRAFTPAYREGRMWLKAQMLEAGLSVTLDAGANLIGRREGTHSSRALVSGSHIDTVVGGGRFDGILGVLAALEVAQTLGDDGMQLHHALEVVDFMSEEPSDYGASCIGSRVWVGTLSPAMLEATNGAGERLSAAINRMGGDASQLETPLRSSDELAAYVELHIEQGRVLEAAGADIGEVTGIVAIQRYELLFTGRADHAGTTPMTLRSDALVAASRFTANLSDAARLEAGIVATVGRLEVMPNNSNVVPGGVRLTFEARSLEVARLEDFCGSALESARDAATLEGVHLESKLVSTAAPLIADARIRAAIRHAAQGVACLALPSGAGHDAMQVGRLCPAGMIFIPCRDGRSHAQDEFSTPAQLVIGAQVLLETIVKLDRVFA